MSKIIGILGGLGPAATIDLFQKIVANTPAKVDQEHLKIIIYNNPKIPPRKLYTSDQIKTNSLIQELATSAQLLERSGADFIVMPCHTAHIWYENIINTINIPFYSIVDNTVKEVIKENDQSPARQKKNVLLLSTSTTANSMLYQSAFKNSSINLIIPNNDEQEMIDKLILNIKSDKFASSNIELNNLNKLLIDYKYKGVSSVLGACTEIPLIFQFINANLKKIDPTLLLALMCIKKAQS